jgi:hypothetical protein
MNASTQKNWGAVWIDHFKATMVRPQDNDTEVSTVFSGLESKHRSTGGKAKSKPYMHETGPFSAQHHEAHQKHELQEFYQKVAAVLDDVTDLLVLGIGRAPHEFAEYFQNDPRHREVRVTAEKAEEMSERQLQRAAREHFEEAAPRIWPSMPGQPLHP